jgi:Halocarboxylic acid dehydrogenase DehI
MTGKKQRRILLAPETEAQGRVLEIYRELRIALGVPHVSLLFQAYGAYPTFLEAHWQAIKAMLATAEFFQFGDRLRAEAYTRAHNYFAVPDFRTQVEQLQLTEGACHELGEIIELFHYNNPLLLLIAAAQTRAFDEPVLIQRESVRPSDHPEFGQKPCSVPERTATAQVKKIYEDIKRTLGIPFVNSDYRALGRFPDFLETYWSAMKPALSSLMYSEHKRQLDESALAFYPELPFAPQLSIERMQEIGLKDEAIAEIVRITRQFLELSSGSTLNVSFAKIGLEGGTMRTHKISAQEPVRERITPKEPAEISDHPEQAA